MTMKELCKICAKYSHNVVKINILISNISEHQNHSHLDWAIKRDTKLLNKLIDRQIGIERMIINDRDITF